MIWLWWAPLGCVTLHLGEEFVYPGGFASWDRAYRPAIRDSITPGLHIVVNALLLAACVAVGLAGMPGAAVTLGGARVRSAIPASMAAPAWLALSALLLSNAVFHLLGTLRTKRMSPGVRTGLLLYVPLAVFGFGHFLRSGQVTARSAAVAALLGGSYHLWASLIHRLRSRNRET